MGSYATPPHSNYPVQAGLRRGRIIPPPPDEPLTKYLPSVIGSLVLNRVLG